MIFPKDRMRFTSTVQGKTEADGFITLALAGVDLDGVNTLALRVADIEALRRKGDQASDQLNAARTLLGRIGSDE